MDDLVPGIEALRDGLTPNWNDARGALLLERICRSRRRRRTLLLGALAAAFVFASVVGRSLLTAADDDSRSEPPSRAAEQNMDRVHGAEKAISAGAPRSRSESSGSRPLPASDDEIDSGWRSLYRSGDYDAAARR